MDTKAPTWVLNAVTGNFLGDEVPTPSAPTPSASRVQAFISSATWQGAKPGFYFGRGGRGQGYYTDSLAPQGEGAGGEKGDGNGQAKPLDPEELLRQAEEDAGVDEVAGSPELYPVLVEMNVVPTLLACLSHENVDIAADAVELLMELTSADAVEEFQEEAKSLVASLLGANALELLVQRLVTFNERASDEEAAAVNNCLNIFENMIEVETEIADQDMIEVEAVTDDQDMIEVEADTDDQAPELLVQPLVTFSERASGEEAAAVNNCPNIFENMNEVETDIADQVVEKTRLLKWLLGRILHREFDVNEQYASEILAIVVEKTRLLKWLLGRIRPREFDGNEAIQKKIGETGGMDTLLQCVACYKSKDPQTAEEEEFMQNCFDVLCSCLMVQDNKALFVKSEGVELMWLMLQSKKQARYGSIKCLDFITTRFTAPCDSFVDLGGLKNLFGMFMGKTRIKGPRGERDVDTEIEERAVSIISNLCQNLGVRGGRRERVSSKFVENEFEKCDRLMEIYFSVRVIVEEDELLMIRMDAGLFTLQQCVLILSQLWSTGDVGLRKRALMLLHQKGQSLSNIRDVLLEYYYSIGSDGGEEESKRLRSRATELLLSIGHR
eukprot:gene16784-23060_t